MDLDLLDLLLPRPALLSLRLLVLCLSESGALSTLFSRDLLGTDLLLLLGLFPELGLLNLVLRVEFRLECLKLLLRFDRKDLAIYHYASFGDADVSIK